MINNKLLVNLRIIGNIQKNGRICKSFNGIIALESNSKITSLKRTLYGDSRIQTLHEINSIITDCENSLTSIYNSKYLTSIYKSTEEYFLSCEDINAIITEITLAKMGIENLKFTYIEDINTSSQLDVILMRIKNILRDANYKYAFYMHINETDNGTSNVQHTHHITINDDDFDKDK